MSSADNLSTQFGPRSVLTEHQAGSGSNLFDTLEVFLKLFFEKAYFEKSQQTAKNMKNYAVCKYLKVYAFIHREPSGSVVERLT